MARFIFKLDGVLRQRKHAEQQKQRELAIVQANFARLQTELRTLNDGITDATADLRKNHLTGVIDLNFLAAHRRFIAATQRQAMLLVQKMALAQRQVEDAQKSLAEAAKQRKVIEKLRERYHERWLADLNRREVAEQDEIAMQLSYQDYAGLHDVGDAEVTT